MYYVVQELFLNIDNNNDSLQFKIYNLIFFGKSSKYRQQYQKHNAALYFLNYYFAKKNTLRLWRKKISLKFYRGNNQLTNA